MKAENILEKVNSIDLTDIEQFTIIIIEFSGSIKACELVWDGYKKHLKELPNLPVIWSSSTLYDEGVKQLRKEWFSDWQQNKGLSHKNILEFHHNAGIGDKHIDVMMDRGLGGTVSITSIKKKGSFVEMSYEDVRNAVDTVLLKYECHK